MPGTPASRHTCTASSTLGADPPRELRSVATLLTLTDRRVMRSFRFQALGQGSAELALHDVDDFLRPGVYLGLTAAFQHDAQKRFGPGVPDENPSLSVDL